MKKALLMSIMALGVTGNVWGKDTELLRQLSEYAAADKQAPSATCFAKVTKEKCSDTPGLAEVAQEVCPGSLIAGCLNAATKAQKAKAEAEESFKQERNENAGAKQKNEDETIARIIASVRATPNNALKCTLAAQKCRELSSNRAKQIVRDNLKANCLTGQKARDAGWRVDPLVACS